VLEAALTSFGNGKLAQRWTIMCTAAGELLGQGGQHGLVIHAQRGGQHGGGAAAATAISPHGDQGATVLDHARTRGASGMVVRLDEDGFAVVLGLEATR
jgi:hypothetical protein